MVVVTVSVTKGPPLIAYLTSKWLAGASSRFLTLTTIDVEFVNWLDVNFLPETGEMMASIFRSLSDILPLHPPKFGCIETGMALLPDFPLILGLTVTKYRESFESPLKT